MTPEMPSKKKKYNARFPAGRIKKIMQSDEEVGKVAQAVPVIISRTLELFVESLLTKTLKITNSRNAKTLSPSHMKQCIMSESRFDFLRELVKNIPDISVAEESAHDSSPGPPSDNVQQSSQHHQLQQQQRAIDYRMPSTSCEASCSSPTKNGSPLLGNGVLQIAVGGELGITATATNATKRRTESVQESRKRTADSRTANIQGNSVIQHTSDCTEGECVSPPKLLRMDSVPTATFSDSRKNSTKRLMHQSKSVPCSSKEASLHQHLHHQHQPQQPVIPAPIVDINICNKPIVKIDYSNLVLPDKDSSSGSSSDQNSMSNCINPVINIDLSKITTQPSSELQAVSLSAGSVKSSLELDEDYDNI